MLNSGIIWEKLKIADDNGFLINASTPGEDRWTETGGNEEEDGLVPGHAYSILKVKEYKNLKLLNIRNPWGYFEWFFK